MSDYGDNIKYKWTPESTTLLVSVWTDKQVQKQFEYASKPQLIWESVARYMRKKGYTVSAKQCRSRMKQVLVCYREAKRAGTKAGVEQYYESIDRVLQHKKSDSDDNGVDTVDSAVPVKSPPKDVKTNKNLKMRFNKYEPIESLIRTEALSPTWHLAHEEVYPDSPESNETVLAQPYRTFSPTRDAATNTLNARSQLLTKGIRQSMPIDEDQPNRDVRPSNSVPNNRFGEMIYQNAVQNVQNQIIQENMQQRNILQNQYMQTENANVLQPEQIYRVRNNPIYVIDETVPLKLRSGNQRMDVIMSNPPMIENTMRMQNQLQQSCPADNRAMPQEPRRENFAQNLVLNCKHYKDGNGPNYLIEQNVVDGRQRSTNYSPETAVNLNEAFCQVYKEERNHNLNETYTQQPIENDVIRGMNATTITNNATFNDDTLSIEFLENSPSPSDNGAGGPKSLSGNSDRVPHVPVRRKKAQKLEQLMLNAITSQNEVVNKILAAQDAMVSRFLDLDRERQNRLENRLDHLMNVVHSSVINKNDVEKDNENNGIPTSETVITSLAPPPRPGAIPPKLDLVPPKPCRVPCTLANTNIELINQNPIQTRPGIVSPIKQPGSIWTKLGPVSQSPFVKAQQQLGFRVSSNIETRTKSSAERKIVRDMEQLSMDRRELIFETEKFLEVEKHIEEQTENAKIIAKMGQEVAARRKLFESRREPNPGMILSAAFLDAERYFSSVNSEPLIPPSSSSGGARSAGTDDDEELLLLANQVDNYERLRRLNLHAVIPENPCDTSTPAKPSEKYLGNEGTKDLPKQKIQQLAQLVMKSARWRDAAANDRATNRFAPSTFNQGPTNDFNIPTARNILNPEGQNNNNEDAMKRESQLARPPRRSYAGEIAENESRNKALGWLQDRYSYGGQKLEFDHLDLPSNRATAPHEPQPPAARKSFPMGFTMENIIRDSNENRAFDPRMNLNPDFTGQNPYARRTVGFVDPDQPSQPIVEQTGPTTFPRRRRELESKLRLQNQNFFMNNEQYSTLPAMHRNMIDRYVQDKYGPIVKKNQDESDDDEVFLDTTATMQPQSRKTSLTSSGTSSAKAGNCVIS